MIEEKYVDIRNKEERKDFIENLETKGYIIDKTFFNRDDIIGGIFPLVVDLTNKKINMIGNVTTSAAAVSSGVLISKEQFELLLKYKDKKILDGIIGFAIGDALGVPAEFKSRNELKINPIVDMIEGGAHNQEKGTFSDDTSMTLATMDSIISKKVIDTEDLAKKFVDWYRKSEYTATGKIFDIGDTTRQALAKFELKIDKAVNCGGVGEYDNGNGSLMRLLPIVYYIYYKKIDNEIKIYNIVKEVSSITHAHEISVLGCYIYTRYCLLLLEGNDKFEAYKKLQQLNYSMFSKNTFNRYERILIGNILSESEDDISSSGYVVSTLEAVMWLFLNSNDYNSTILKAVNLGNDTDTIAAITGSLLGIYYGLDSINDKWRLSLKKYDYIIDLCKKFEEIL